MLRCNTGQCSYVNGPELARLTQKQLGFVDPATAAQALAGAKNIFDKVRSFFSGLIGKNPDRAQFDSVRQAFWTNYASVYDAVQGLRRSNQLTSEILNEYVNTLGELLNQYQGYYDRVRDAVGPEWGDSRFRDFYDPAESTFQAWKREITAGTLPSSTILGGIAGGLNSTSMLLLGAFALAIFSGSRRRS